MEIENGKIKVTNTEIRYKTKAEFEKEIAQLEVAIPQAQIELNEKKALLEQL